MYILNNKIIIIINRLENLFNASKNDHLTHVDPKLYTKCPQEYKLMNDKYLSKKPIFAAGTYYTSKSNLVVWVISEEKGNLCAL